MCLDIMGFWKKFTWKRTKTFVSWGSVQSQIYRPWISLKHVNSYGHESNCFNIMLSIPFKKTIFLYIKM